MFNGLIAALLLIDYHYCPDDGGVMNDYLHEGRHLNDEGWTVLPQLNF